ncbi:MAG: hypothetical protein MZV65_41775 [Chromatiales bacterium]|nr:hypothetical protein [Chromatiales bacterium]
MMTNRRCSSGRRRDPAHPDRSGFHAGRRGRPTDRLTLVETHRTHARRDPSAQGRDWSRCWPANDAAVPDPPPLTADDQAAIQESITERAAILEFDAGMERRQAETAGAYRRCGSSVP